MIWRAFSAAMMVFFAWAALMQLNDPDPARWFAIYAAVAALAACGLLNKELPRAATLLGAIALLWALAIMVELLGRWSPADLGATMSAARPEVEYGREFVGLAIVAGYCFSSAWRARRQHLDARAARLNAR